MGHDQFAVVLELQFSILNCGIISDRRNKITVYYLRY